MTAPQKFRPTELRMLKFARGSFFSSSLEASDHVDHPGRWQTRVGKMGQ